MSRRRTRPAAPPPSMHLAFNPAPGVVAFACGFTPPEPIASMRERANTPPFFLWTFDHSAVGCPACQRTRCA